MDTRPARGPHRSQRGMCMVQTLRPERREGERRGVRDGTGVVPSPARTLPAREAGTMDSARVLTALGARVTGLSSADAASRLTESGPNALRTHDVRVLAVLGRQLHSALLGLLF